MRLATCNLDRDKTELLEAQIAALPAGTADYRLRVLDLSVPGYRLPAGLRPRIVGCPAGDPPVDIARRWAWDADRQSYQILPHDEDIYVLGGGAEGAMYGFYRCLADLCGCRWYSLAPEDELAGVPPRPLPRGIIKPDVVWRGFEGSLGRWDTPFIARLFRWMLRNGWNLVLFNAGQWAAREDRDQVARLASQHAIRLVIGGHAAEHFLPTELFKEHPEYFGWRDGARRVHTEVASPDLPGRTRQLPVQPCYGNVRTRRFLAERIAAFIDQTPQMTAFSLWPHDGSNNWCQCDDCLSSTPYAMVHDLAREILACTRRPVPIEILAYCNLLDPPRSPLTPEPRIYTLFCPYLRQYRHRFYDPGFAPDQLTLGRRWPEPEPVNPLDDREYGVLLQQWLPHLAQSKSGLGIFAYYQLAFVDETGRSDRSRFLYHPDPALVADEIRAYHAQGMRLFYDCSWPLPGFWPDGRYYAYLGRLLWNVKSDPPSAIDAFYRETLGDLGGSVQAALAAVAAALDRPGRPAVESDVLQAAVEAVAPVTGPRGDRYRVWLEYVRLADAAWQRRPDAAAEEAIQVLLEQHASLLGVNLMVPWMARHSKGMQRMAERKMALSR